MAVGGDLSVDRLLLAYSNGFFPWYSFQHQDEPLWYCPLQRFVIFPNEIHVSHSMRQLIKSRKYDVTINRDFEGVIHGCATAQSRNQEDGAWLGPDIIKAYTELHRQGFAASVEVWDEDHIADIDPFSDIEELLNRAEEIVSVSKLLISPTKLGFLMRSPKMRQAVMGNDHSSGPLTLNTINNFMESNGLPPFVKIRRKCRVRTSTGYNTISPWKDANIVAVPEGKIGIIKNAYSNNELRPEPGVSYSNYGRIRISEWGVGETQGMNGAEYTKAESLSLPVITAIEGIFTLKTDTKTE